MTFEQLENLIDGFGPPPEDAAGTAEEDILDFAEDFWTLCGNLDNDASLSMDQVRVALGDFGFSDAEVEAAIATFEATVTGASGGSFSYDTYMAAAETPEIQGILQRITPGGVDTRSAAQLFDQMDEQCTGTLKKEQFKKLVGKFRDDIEDAGTLIMVIDEMDIILRDRDDDGVGCDSLRRAMFVSAVREGAFEDLLFPPPANLTSPRGSGRRGSGSFEKRGSFGSGKFRRNSFGRSRKGQKSFRHGRMRAESTGDGGQEFSIGTPDANDEMKRVKRKYQIQADKKQQQSQIGNLTPIPGSRLSVGGGVDAFDASTPNPGMNMNRTGSFRKRSSTLGAPGWAALAGAPGSVVARMESDAHQKEHEEQFLKQTFNVYSHGNETISPNDFAEIMLDESITGEADANKSYSRNFIKNLMDQLDTNGDGKCIVSSFPHPRLRAPSHAPRTKHQAPCARANTRDLLVARGFRACRWPVDPPSPLRSGAPPPVSPLMYTARLARLPNTRAHPSGCVGFAKHLAPPLYSAKNLDPPAPQNIWPLFSAPQKKFPLFSAPQNIWPLFSAPQNIWPLL